MTTDNTKKYISNTIWLVGSKVYRVSLSLIVTIMIARYLGPEQFGDFSYAISFVGLFLILITLGLENIVVKKLVSGNVTEDINIVVSGIVIRLIGSGLFLFTTNLIIIINKPEDDIIQLMVFIMSLAYVFKTFEILRYWFESKIKAKVSSLLEVFSFTISASIKIGIIFLNLPIFYFSYAILIEQLIFSLLLLLLFFINRDIELKKIKFGLDLPKRIFIESLPLAFSGALYMIYSKVDQIMIGEMVGSKELGLYAAAVQISEGWFFIPVAIATSLYPKILKAKQVGTYEYIYSTQKLLYLMSFVGYSASIVISIIAPLLIELSFGSNYLSSINILILHVWGGLFIAVNTIASRYLISEGLQKYSFYRGFLGMIVNIAMNYYLIPMYGAYGAAISTVISQILALYLLNGLGKKTRDVFLMQTKALVFYDYWFLFKNMNFIWFKK
ncbi:flippase [Vibrio furnissii]|uniref:flippase n=1 Tax=Vibrio furnissii TaxID=29494 RepID=UPI001EEBB009|nr:flippase [Vibrio furnissii]MCG6267270.1 flippase [Vibrio furnissii]